MGRNWRRRERERIEEEKVLSWLKALHQFPHIWKSKLFKASVITHPRDKFWSLFLPWFWENWKIMAVCKISMSFIHQMLNLKFFQILTFQYSCGYNFLHQFWIEEKPLSYERRLIELLFDIKVERFRVNLHIQTYEWKDLVYLVKRRLRIPTFCY